jgi:hypothetical protein
MRCQDSDRRIAGGADRAQIGRLSWDAGRVTSVLRPLPPAVQSQTIFQTYFYLRALLGSPPIKAGTPRALRRTWADLWRALARLDTCSCRSGRALCRAAFVPQRTAFRGRVGRYFPGPGSAHPALSWPMEMFCAGPGSSVALCGEQYFRGCWVRAPR